MGGSVSKFSFFASFYEAAQDLDDEKRLAFYDAMASYAFTGEEPDFSGVMSTIWKLTKPNIDSSINGQRTGGKGGRPKKDNSPLKPPVKTHAETDRDMDGDGDGELDALEIDPKDQSISNASASVGAAAAGAEPPAAKGPSCPECGSPMRYDESAMLWLCSECDGTLSFAELIGSARRRRSPAWVCPVCETEVSCDPDTGRRVCPVHGIVEAVVRP